MGEIHILSSSGQPFKNRREAGLLLGRELKKLDLEKPLVLGIPRGGLVIAQSIAEELDAELDVVLSRKLRAPDNSELAIGAIGEDGKLFLHDWLQHELQVDNAYIQREKQLQLSEIVNRDMRYRKILPRIVPEGRDVVVTDDGIATGATFQAALWSVRHEKPNQLIAALPVGPHNSIVRVAQDSDELVCLMVPPYFAAVGQFYSDFSQIEDDEVMAILEQENRRRKLRSHEASVKGELKAG